MSVLLRALLCLALAAPAAAFAQLSYQYVQVNYLSPSIDDEMLDDLVDSRRGLQVQGAFDLGANLALQVDYSRITLSIGAAVAGVGSVDGSVAQNLMQVGLLGYNGLAPGTDVFLGAAYLKMDGEAEVAERSARGELVDSERFSFDDTGYALMLGLRHLLSEALEVNVQFTRMDVGGTTESTTTFGMLMRTSSQASVGMSLTSGEEIDLFAVGLRLNY